MRLPGRRCLTSAAFRLSARQCEVRQGGRRLGACCTTVAVAYEQRPWWLRRPPTRGVLSITGVVLLLGGFVWLWWQGVPALYRTAGSGQDVENVRLNAATTTRAALLAGFVGLGALGTFWLNSRVYRITARTFELTERGHLSDRYSKAIEQRSEEHTSELQSRQYLVCRLLLEKKKNLL